MDLCSTQGSRAGIRRKGQGKLGGLEQRERNLACSAEPLSVRLTAGTSEARFMLNLLSPASLVYAEYQSVLRLQ